MRGKQPKTDWCLASSNLSEIGWSWSMQVLPIPPRLLGAQQYGMDCHEENCCLDQKD